VGIISSVFINHATPAAFYAKIVGRDDYYNIGKQLVSSSFDYFAGGIIKDAYKPDNKSIYELAEINRYKVIETMAQFNALQPADGKVIVGSLALNGGENIKPSIDRTPSELSLADYLSKGIEMLDNPDGFLIMCEGGQIDWACHANDLAQSIGEVIDFDNAINVALRFYNQHPDQTLIVITSDHETGGLSLGSNKMKYEMNPMVLHNQKLSNESFNSRVIKPLKKSGSVGLKQVSDSIRKYYSLGGEIALDEWDNQRIEKAYNASFNHVGEKSVQDSLLYDKYEPVGLVSSRILAEKAGFSWTTFVHTAMPVPVRSVGVGSELFNNLQDNTQLAPIIRDLMSQ
jgi:alkaline phosphatase